jgi:two-component system sensor histidine kinase KdpD
MLSEGHRRLERGTDVVVGYVEDHDRAHTRALVAGLEVVPRQIVDYRGSSFTEMDVDALIERRPDQALVDEFAHTNVPGSRNPKRWQDVEELLAAGIDVITTLNVQHLESVNDVVEAITGVPQRETVPDEMVRAAEQIELVDMTPEALQRRMAHGNIYAPDKVDAALSNYFRVGNLGALRELALLWLADRVDEGLQRYRTEHRIEATWETRERVVVAVTGGPEGATIIRRAFRVARRGGADVLAVHVARGDGLTGADPVHLAEQRELVESLGGTFHQVLGDDVPRSLLEFARAENATQLVIGATRRGPLSRWLAGAGIGAAVIRGSGAIDVHVVTHEEAGQGTAAMRRLREVMTTRRRLAGFAAAAILLPLTTLVLAQLRGQLTLASDLLIYLLVTVVVAAIGGVVPGLVAAVAASLLANYYFTPPLYTLTIAERNNALAIGVFVVVSVVVAAAVDYASRRTAQAARAGREAATLASLSATVLRGRGTLQGLLDQARETFSLRGVALCHYEGMRRDVVASSGDVDFAAVTAEVPIEGERYLAICGPAPSADDQRLLAAFANQIGAAETQEDLERQAEAAALLGEVDRTRSALLTAVSHDLRTPLASLGTALSGLATRDVELTEADRAELLESAQRSIARLNRLVENLLDLSRLQAGALSVRLEPVDVGDAVAGALDELEPASLAVTVEVPDGLPAVLADQPLLERVLVNLLANALRHSPQGSAPLVAASSAAGRVEVRVVDVGPGVSPEKYATIFAPFQRLGDVGPPDGTGVGLGLALARGLTEAMAGTVAPEETPGGGLTMRVSLPAAALEEIEPAEVEVT